MRARSALIVGGGVAGLSAAWWLGRSGWQVTVLEKAPDLRSDGYMIGLSGPGYEAARAMGLLPALTQRSREVNENVYYDRQGRVVLRLKYRDFMPDLDWVTLLRSDLVAVLHDELPKTVDVRFSTTIARYEDRDDCVCATLSDGQQIEADILIGADGLHSHTRALTFGTNAAIFEPLGYRVAAFHTDNICDLDMEFQSYAEPGRMAEFYALPDNRVASLYIWRSDDTAVVAGKDRRASLLSAFDGAHPNATRWIDALPEEQPFFFDQMSMVRLSSWSKGRVLLLGDSAHCLTLVAGQGAGMAMWSAGHLQRVLSTEDDSADGVARAFQRHETDLRPAISQLQERSRKVASWYIPTAPWKFHLRNKILRAMPKRMLGWYFRRSVHKDVMSANDLLPAADSADQS